MTVEKIREKLERLIGQTVRLSVSVHKCYVTLTGTLRWDRKQGEWNVCAHGDDGSLFRETDVVEICNDHRYPDLKVILIREVGE